MHLFTEQLFEGRRFISDSGVFLLGLGQGELYFKIIDDHNSKDIIACIVTDVSYF